jgi:membrane protein required for colicin V production
VNAVDIAVVVVLLASGVFALTRGFVYEVLAMAGWIAAGLAALWGLPFARPLVHTYIANPTLVDVVGGVVIFLVVLLVSSLITHAISRRVRRSAVSSVDRSLGFAFGLLRGFVLASLCFLAVSKLMAPDEPEILAQAKTRPLMIVGARMLQSLVPARFSGVEEQAGQRAKEASDMLDKAAKANDAYGKLLMPKPKSADPSKNDRQPNYDSNGLERLIETTTGK